jgi:hypothetical protein
MKILRMLLFPVCSFAVWIALLIHIYIPITAFAQSEAVLSGIQVRRIGVMPFFKGKYGSTMKDTLEASVSKLYFNPENLAENSARILTGYLQEALQKRHGEKVVPDIDVTMALERISKNGTKDTPKGLAQKTGLALRANLFIVGTVWRFKERVGGAMGAQSPASVAFAISLIETDSGKMLWKASFDKTEKSLSEDIRDARAFFKKGAKWLTASELARYGIEEIFKKYPL